VVLSPFSSSTRGAITKPRFTLFDEFMEKKQWMGRIGTRLSILALHPSRSSSTISAGAERRFAVLCVLGKSCGEC
jgi:hypothetical protein